MDLPNIPGDEWENRWNDPSSQGLQNALVTTCDSKNSRKDTLHSDEHALDSGRTLSWPRSSNVGKRREFSLLGYPRCLRTGETSHKTKDILMLFSPLSLILKQSHFSLSLTLKQSHFSLSLILKQSHFSLSLILKQSRFCY